MSITTVNTCNTTITTDLSAIERLMDHGKRGSPVGGERMRGWGKRSGQGKNKEGGKKIKG